MDAAVGRSRSDVCHNMDSFSQHENKKTLEQEEGSNTCLQESEENSTVDFNIACSESNIWTDEYVNENARSLTKEQKEVFDSVHKWVRDHVKYSSSREKKKIQVHLFITDRGVCGKCKLLRAVYQSITKTLKYNGGDPLKSKVLLQAPTGVAAINIDGTTIHSVLIKGLKNFYLLNYIKSKFFARSYLR